jgi:hypothetical protein
MIRKPMLTVFCRESGHPTRMAKSDHRHLDLCCYVAIAIGLVPIDRKRKRPIGFKKQPSP